MSTSRSRIFPSAQPAEYKLIPLTKGKFAKVSNEDFDHLSKINWYMDNECYAGGRVSPRSMHVYIFCVLMGNPAPTRFVTVVDHENRDTLDNRRTNLRIATHSQNTINSKLVAGKTSKFRRVSWHKESSRWEAYVTINRQQIRIGSFKDELEAAWMHDQWAIELHGDFAQLNFDYELAV